MVCPDLMPANGQKQTFGSLMDSLESCCSDGADSLVLCGISLGAVMSLEFYLRHPDKVKAMILIAPQYKMPTVLLGIQNIIFKLMPGKVFLDSHTTKDNMISISKSMKHLDYRANLAAVKCPVYIVCGEKDKANLKAAKSLNNVLEHSEMIIIDGTGHEVNVEVPNKLAAIIQKAIEEMKTDIQGERTHKQR